MPLSKQLFSFVAVLLLLIICFNSMLNIQRFQQTLLRTAQQQTQDTATALSTILSPYMGNEADVMLETMINSFSERGQYQQIKLVNAAGKSLVNINSPELKTVPPQWFNRSFDPILTTASSSVNAGWKPQATVFVTSNPQYWSQLLWNNTKQTFFDTLLLLSLALLSLAVLIKWLLIPFFKKNPNALLLNNTTIDPSKVKVNISFLKKRLHLDELTGFKKKDFFDADIQQLYSENKEAFIVMIKVDGLGGLAKELGGEGIDTFLKQFAEELKTVTDQYPANAINAYRLFGSEFVLLIRQLTLKQLQPFAKACSDHFSILAKNYQRIDIAHIGIARFDALNTQAENIAAANEAYEQAKLIDVNGYYFRNSQQHAKGNLAWKTLVYDIIDNNDYTVAFTSQVLDCKTSTILMEDAVTQAHDQGVAIKPIGTFVAIAEKFSKIVDLDRGIIQKVIAHIKADNIKHCVTISVSTRTLKNPAFRLWLENTIGQQPIAKQLIFSFSAYAVTKEIAAYKEFIDFVHSLGAKVMLKRFEMQHISLEMANTLNVDYIRLPRKLSHNLAVDQNKRNFIQTLQDISTRLGIPVLAENVSNDQDYSLIQSIGLTGASR